MKKAKIYLGVAMASLLSASAVSCIDGNDWEVDSSHARLFSPDNSKMGIDAEEVEATLTFAKAPKADYYIIEVSEDSLYDEIPLGAGNTVVYGEDKSITSSPVLLTNLEVYTKYYLRIKAVTNDEGESKWSYFTTGSGKSYFRTKAKQFLKSPKTDDIQDRSITLHWEVEEGFDVSTIAIGNMERDITPEEKEAGMATIVGLEPETTYTAYLYYNGKQCGKRSFVTTPDLEAEGTIVVYEGDNLKNVIENAPENATIAVYGGVYQPSSSIKINRNVTIKGIYDIDRPIIKGYFDIYNGAGLNLSRVNIENSSISQVFIYRTVNATYEALDVQNCEISGLKTGKGLLYLSDANGATVEAITFNNCIVHGIECSGGDFIDSRKGYPKKITLTNSTFYTVATSRDFIRIDDMSDSFPGVDGPVVTVDHCTLYKVGSGSVDYRMFYLQFKGNKITFTNNVVVGTKYNCGFANNEKTDANPILQNNYYYDCKNLNSIEDTDPEKKVKWVDGAGTIDNPKFKDTGNANFTLGSSSAANRGRAGDPRWLPEED